LPWFLKKDYSFLKKLEPGSKNLNVSIVMSNSNILQGHTLRNSFLECLKKSEIAIDLFGRGINFIDDKFDALYPYKYSFAFENTACPHYWTEKIADCFLTWTMPIYYGASNINDYFPEESMLTIDINKPDEAIELVKKSIRDKRWEKNLNAIEHARNMVLDKYQLFPFIADLIKNNETYDQLPKEHFFMQGSKKSTLSKKKSFTLLKIKTHLKNYLSK
jgi:hypothetical protein